MSDDASALLQLMLTHPRLAQGAALTLRATSARVALVGPSGVGKTTLARAILGLEAPARGRVALGEVVWQDSARGVWLSCAARRIGWIDQEATLLPHLSVLRNLTLSGASEQEARRVAARLDAEHLLTRRADTLSGGERQRACLTRALAMRPALHVWDEPFNALDPELRARVFEASRALLDAQRAPLLLISHDARDVSALCEEVWTMREAGLEREVLKPA